MKLPVRLTLVCVLAALLIACDTNKETDKAPSPPAATAEPVTAPTPVATNTQQPLPEPGHYMLDLTPGNVSVRANQVSELELLEQIAATAGFELLTDDLQWNTVTVDIHADNLHAALTELVRAYPYQIVYTPDKDTQQEVLSAVYISKDLPPATVASPNKTATKDSSLPEEEEDLPDPETQAQLQALQNESAEIRAAAAEDIDPTGEALLTLTELITRDPSPEVRVATAQALEFSDDPLAIQALKACLKDEFPVVLVACIETLEHIGDSSNAAQLQPLLEHYDLTVRNSAAQAIENLQ